MVASQCLQGSVVNVSSADFPATEDLLYVAPQRNLQYVIVPEMKFNCYGNITAWSALTLVDSTGNLLSVLDYVITFQRFSYFKFDKKQPTSNKVLSFQPGDVVGWTIERSLETPMTIIGPISVVYRRATSVCHCTLWLVI